MIAAFSCSSPFASVALIGDAGDVLFSEQVHTMHNASGECIEMLQTALAAVEVSLRDITLFAADVGPGSFIGTRVGVVLAKTFSFACSTLATGADAFDLIDPLHTAVVPSRRGEYFIRVPGEAPYRASDLPEGRFSGYGENIAVPVYPNAASFASLIGRLIPQEPQDLLPKYLIEPSISIPKKPYTQRVDF